METFNQKEILSLFSNICCSHCKNDFTIDSIKVIKRNKDILICKLSCCICGKNFGDVVLNINKKSNIHAPLEIIEGPPPISFDDVIDAYNFINKNLH